MAIKNIVSNTLTGCFLLLLFFLEFTWIIFDFNGSSESLKDSWSIVSSIFSGITTLAAAYIAYGLYDDWRTPHNVSIETEHKKEILKVIRKILPLEYQYNRLISNHFVYHDNPEMTIPIDLKDEEITELASSINELLGLLEELYFITKDQKINNLKDYYYNYAQLYTYILHQSNYFYKNGDKTTLREFLRTNLRFNYINEDNQECSSFTQYAYAFRGLSNVKLRQYISENLKTSISD
jgi:hypothetical protein